MFWGLKRRRSVPFLDRRDNHQGYSSAMSSRFSVHACRVAGSGGAYEQIGRGDMLGSSPHRPAEERGRRGSDAPLVIGRIGRPDVAGSPRVAGSGGAPQAIFLVCFLFMFRARERPRLGRRYRSSSRGVPLVVRNRYGLYTPVCTLSHGDSWRSGMMTWMDKTLHHLCQVCFRSGCFRRPGHPGPPISMLV